jgi:hypothetical protein
VQLSVPLPDRKRQKGVAILHRRHLSFQFSTTTFTLTHRSRRMAQPISSVSPELAALYGKEPAEITFFARIQNDRSKQVSSRTGLSSTRIF